ncbi:MalY/PatB family protein [Loigolactobacillus backii]|uniref:cysteine-S-conjugate beta-lyase n=1 Tax=Loigolactobacillus backii TaxID=375175 RepID=A0A192H1X5_9LACO|nr:PatB family C-S lyase [Loigolactobacillus backii]ANK61946.1 beta-cystathionase [Loigolactobacillus backii]ANK65438.1 beta-cystathionase [Loigolactobacillus backii]ANK68860.1 beta-cystathionase [Loigolactobacillus backii]MDA5386858.1 PatB family C-S lyase [Loigolactobacillus backii]MDA5389357.1 PatB family C-S lyase [Loigolactobacillus backii]
MKIDFDKVIDRHHTFSTQWDYISDRFGREDILPFSISDTDFPVPEEVQAALTKRMAHPIYGYTRWNHAEYKDSIVNWFKNRHQTKIAADWISYSPSVGFSIASFIRMKSEENDGVIVFAPMYDAFYNIIQSNHRRLLPVKLTGADQNYQIDWDTLRLLLEEEHNKILLLTNPHNPTGKVFSKKELQKIVQLCQQNHVFIISDDIHSDIVYGTNSYTPITELTHKDIVLCSSASKTFNIPGLVGSYLLCPDDDLLVQFLHELKQKNALSSASIFGITAQIAAYNQSVTYVDELKAYLAQNMQLVQDFIAKNIPELIFVKPEATYLAWINVSKLNLTSAKLQDKLVNTGRVGIMAGATYGDSHYIRMNIACPRKKLEDGLNRLALAIHA